MHGAAVNTVVLFSANGTVNPILNVVIEKVTARVVLGMGIELNICEALGFA